MVVSLQLAGNGYAQGFANLGFETTTITPVVFPGGTRYTATVPGWTWTPSGNGVNGDPNSVGFNEYALDSPAVSLEGTDSSIAPAIQGNYSILLQGGSQFYPQQGGGASVFQTGLIPVTARSLIYLGGAGLQVSFNGHSLSPVALQTAPSYTKWGIDISPYAGQSGELRFAVPWLSESILDGIQFSSGSVPEPSAPSLSILGFALVGAFTRWPKSRQPTSGERRAAIRASLDRQRGCAWR